MMSCGAFMSIKPKRLRGSRPGTASIVLSGSNATKIRYRRSPGRKTSRNGSVIGRYALSRNTIQIGSTVTTWWSADSRGVQDALRGVGEDLGAEHDVVLLGVL